MGRKYQGCHSSGTETHGKRQWLEADTFELNSDIIMTDFLYHKIMLQIPKRRFDYAGMTR